jgi:hypothetical protein
MSKAKTDYTVRTEGRIEIRKEHDKYGNETGHAYRHCTACKGELLTGRNPEQTPWHKDDCPEAQR